MGTHSLTDQALALPLTERVVLAQALWQSIDASHTEPPTDEEREAIETARRRDAELSSGVVQPRSHEEVLERARRALGCT